MSKYILDEGGSPVKCNDLMVWGRWFEANNDKRTVALDTIGKSRVSTAFIGLDMGYGEGPPLLYETMVFGGPLHEETERYATLEQALAGHAATVARVHAEVRA